MNEDERDLRPDVWNCNVGDASLGDWFSGRVWAEGPSGLDAAPGGAWPSLISVVVGSLEYTVEKKPEGWHRCWPGQRGTPALPAIGLTGHHRPLEADAITRQSRQRQTH